MLVPANRETDWIFSTETGQLQLLLASPTTISRLILVGNHLPLHPPPIVYDCPIPVDPDFRSQLKRSLTPLFLGLSPKLAFLKGALPDIPLLCYEDDIIRSVVVERCAGSCVVGELVVEDVELESGDAADRTREFRRRLRFKRMPNLVQTQIRIVPVTNSSSDSLEFGGEDEQVVQFQLDTSVLVHPYLAPMVASLSLISSYLDQKIQQGIRPPRALCLGVGGGALLTFLNTKLDLWVVGAESDEVVLRIAKQHFGLKASESLQIYVEDGLELLNDFAHRAKAENSDDKFDVIMVDLDSTGPRMGIVAPPLDFVTNSVLLAARLVLCELGILVVNVIPPTTTFYQRLIPKFRDVFEELYEIDVGNGENFVLIATVAPIGTASNIYESSFLTKLRLVISGAYIDSIRKI